MKLKDGDKVKNLRLKHGTQEKTVSGKLRSFKDEKGKTRWEIVVSPPDPWHPAIGFLPENVLED